MRRILSDYVRLFLVAGLIAVVDQITKAIVRANLSMGQVYHPEWPLSHYARIVHLQNYGMAGGFLPGLAGFFKILPVIIGLAILVFYPRVDPHDRLVRFALPIMLGGAIGNLVDRLYQGYVTDFISVGTFPVLNIADACISVGAAILIIGLFFQDEHKRTTGADLCI